MINHRFWLSALSVVFCVWCEFAFAEAYRSKVYLDPSKKINESVALSIEELEKQMGSFSESYARSSAGRHLARHYVQQKQYDKAVNYYQQALSDQGLSAIANQEMTQELATVYLLKKDYSQALSVLTRLKKSLPSVDGPFLLLFGQAQFKSGDYLSLADTLDDLMLRVGELSDAQLKQLLAMSYGSRNYKQSEKVLTIMIDRAPSEMTNWRQLTSLYLMQKKYKKALDQLSLAKEKKLIFNADDIKLLANLYMNNQAAEKGARTLELALADGHIEKTGEHYKQLFEYWLVAREKQKASVALSQAASLSGDTALYLKLAQLYSEREQWSAMQRTVLQACQDVLDDRYVGQANLLLGISQLKQKQTVQARRSLINATLIGSNWKKANQWLSYIQAEPATADELRSIDGPCVPLDPDVRVVEDAIDAKNSRREGEQVSSSMNSERSSDLDVKTVPSARYFYTKASLPAEDVQSKLKSLMVPLAVKLARGGGSIDGPLHLFFSGGVMEQSGKISLQAGFPIRGNPASKGRYKNKTKPEFKCIYMAFDGEGQTLKQAWETLYTKAMASGYELTGEARQVLSQAGDSGGMVSELQLGIQ